MFSSFFKGTNKVEDNFDDSDIILATDLAVHEANRDELTRLMKIISAMSVILVLATCIAIVMLTSPERQKFYAVSVGGQTQQILALSNPIDQTDMVETWLETALAQTYTFNFANYQTQFAASSKNFTVEGWNNWYKSFQTSGGLDSVVSSKLSVSAIALARPLLQSFPRNDHGVYTWVFQVPLSISYQQLNTVQSQSYLYRVYVVRVPVSQNPAGLAIEAIQTISNNIGT